ncbi:MAG TPA: NADH-quinone oxidoreductase subunit NuoG [Chloroflexota bacterium]|nr:NADH-quinone oxidoreductase subunit NuoG [Chloroflexota bacterium]
MDQPVDLVTVTVDGRTVKVPKGTLVVEAARQAGITIPIFCYHPKLKPVGACRMCYVQIEKAPGLATACTSTVADGMIVYTNTAPVEKAQKGLIEFLLINHPLDCPVCDRGGECPLQDNAFGWGGAESRYVEEKRHYVKPVPLSPLVLLDRERCILCYRCVRFQNEIAGDDSLTVLNRGSESEIGVLPGREFDSPFSGNTIEICPVGALTSSKYRFQARPWDIRSVPSVCPHCSVGCNIRVDVRDQEVKRHLSRENAPVDDGWLCDRGRFGYDFVNATDRLATPLVRREGELQPASWQEALEAIRDGFGGVAQKEGANAVGGIISPTSTNEEIYLFQKLFRGIIGTNNVDHSYDPAPATVLDFDAVSGSIVGLERADVIVLVGANPTVDQPVLSLRIRKAISLGARLIVIGSERIDLAREAARVLRVAPNQEGLVVSAILNGILAQDGQNAEFVATRTRGFDELKQQIGVFTPQAVSQSAGVTPEAISAIVDMIAGKRVSVLYPRTRGAGVEGELLVAAITNLVLATGNLGRDGVGVYPLVDHANSQGAIDLGAMPNRLPGQRMLGSTEELANLWQSQLPGEAGIDGMGMLSGGVQALYLVGSDPVGTGIAGARESLGQLRFLVVQDVRQTETANLAQVVLPGLTFAEKEGTLTNLERRIQRLRVAVSRPSDARDDWRVIQDVANWLGGRFLYTSAQDIFDEITRAAPVYGGLTYSRLGFKGIQWPSSQPKGAGDRVLYTDVTQVLDFVPMPALVR